MCFNLAMNTTDGRAVQNAGQLRNLVAMMAPRTRMAVDVLTGVLGGNKKAGRQDLGFYQFTRPLAAVTH